MRASSSTGPVSRATSTSLLVIFSGELVRINAGIVGALGIDLVHPEESQSNRWVKGGEECTSSPPPSYKYRRRRSPPLRLYCHPRYFPPRSLPARMGQTPPDTGRPRLFPREGAADGAAELRYHGRVSGG